MDKDELLECVNNSLAVVGMYITPALTNNDIERICNESNTKSVDSAVCAVVKHYHNNLRYLLFA